VFRSSLTGFLDWLAGCAYLCVFLVATTTATTVCHMTREDVWLLGVGSGGRARFAGPSVGIAVHNVITSAGGMGRCSSVAGFGGNYNKAGTVLVTEPRLLKVNRSG